MDLSVVTTVTLHCIAIYRVTPCVFYCCRAERAGLTFFYFTRVRVTKFLVPQQAWQERSPGNIEWGKVDDTMTSARSIIGSITSACCL